MINHFPLWAEVPEWVCTTPAPPPTTFVPLPEPCPPCAQQEENSVLRPGRDRPTRPVGPTEIPVIPPCDHEEDPVLPDRVFASIRSNPFRVNVGTVVLLTATGFKEKKRRTDAMQFDGPQVACVRRLLFGHECKPVPEQVPCGWILDPHKVHATIDSDDVVISGCQPWQLTACNNIGIIALPGVYQLEFNDATMVGVTQVYAERYNLEALPVGLSGLYFT